MTLRDRMTRAEDYVFGLMSEQERARAERDMEVDPAFRECVMMLAEQLRRLREPDGPVSISDDAWAQISGRIAAMPQMAGMAGTAPDPTRKGMLGVKRPFAHQFGGWKGTVMALALAAAMAVGYVVGQASAPVPSPQTLALLEAPDGTAGALVEAYADRSLRILPLADIEVPPGKVLQVWAVGRPVGVLPHAGEGMLRGPELPLPREGEVYELTLEDAPGVPAGRPPGPVVLSGEAKAAR